jgi:hypothetical protein
MPWLSFVAFKLNWLAAFFWGAEAELLMLLGIVALIALQSYRFGYAVLLPCALLAGLGIAADWLLVWLELLSFKQPGLPLFMALLWVSFALLLPSILALGRTLLLLVVGIMGPVSYYLANLAEVLSLQPSSELTAVLLLPLWTGLACLALYLLEPRHA